MMPFSWLAAGASASAAPTSSTCPTGSPPCGTACDTVCPSTRAMVRTWTSPSRSAERYDPTIGTFSAIGGLGTGRYHHTATPLPDGLVLIAGGYNGGFLTSAERYDVGNGFADARRPVITSVLVTWTAAPGATAYQVFRSTDGVNYAPLAGISGTTYTDLSASSGTAYLYAIRVSAPNVSDNSAPDLATTVIFTDPTLVAQTTPVRAAHLTELRTAVNAARQLAGLAPPSYTDATITTGVTIVKAAHVTELRAALDAARPLLSLPALSYSHATLTTGVSVVSAADISELRNGCARAHRGLIMAVMLTAHAERERRPL